MGSQLMIYAYDVPAPGWYKDPKEGVGMQGVLAFLSIRCAPDHVSTYLFKWRSFLEKSCCPLARGKN